LWSHKKCGKYLRAAATLQILRKNGTKNVLKWGGKIEESEVVFPGALLLMTILGILGILGILAIPTIPTIITIIIVAGNLHQN